LQARQNCLSIQPVVYGCEAKGLPNRQAGVFLYTLLSSPFGLAEEVIGRTAMLITRTANTLIDAEGFRFNVGIILSNRNGQVFWGKRIGQNAWQFPQGGLQQDETPEQAMFRELHEETGLLPHHVRIRGCTRHWLYYRLPTHLIRYHRHPLCIGQKQLWFSLRLLCADDHVQLNSCEHPEFDNWRWVAYWHPLVEVVPFKRRVYKEALEELAPTILPATQAKRPARYADAAGPRIRPIYQPVG